MDRKDLVNLHTEHPEIVDAWEDKIMRLERDREAAWNDLRRVSTARLTDDIDQQADSTYRKIHRLDRSISFLDRALLHLSDVERGTHYADDLPLRP